MADLDGKQASQSVKVTGADPSTGVEDNYLEIDVNGGLSAVLKDDNGNSITAKTVGTQVNSSDVALVINSVLHGVTTGGGGGYVDVKVNPSGALTVDSTVTSSVLPTGAATESTLSTLSSKIPALGQTTMSGSQPVVIASDQTAISMAPTDGKKATYSASAIFGAANNPTDIFTITGSASKTIRITRIEIVGTQTTAAMREILFIKRSTVNSGGSNTVLTNVAHDSTNATGTATVRSYTTNPGSLGTAVGTLKQIKAWVSTVVTQANYITFDYGTRPEQAIVLRGTSEVLAINLNATTSAGNSWDISVTWTEE